MQKLNQFLARLQKLSEEFNLAVLLTNQVQADPGASLFALIVTKKLIIRLPQCLSSQFLKVVY